MKWIYPYQVLFGDVTSRLLGATVDGDPVPTSLVDSDLHQVHLVDSERSDWEVLELELEVVAPATEIEELIQASQQPRAAAILQSGPANSRQAIEMAPSDLEPWRWTGVVQLDRSSWFGRISVRGMVTAEVEGVANRIVGNAPEWTVRLDDLPVPPINGAIRITWDDFTNPEHLAALRMYREEPAFLHLDVADPVLYLNRAFEGLEPLLRDRKRRSPAEQALHDQSRATIATEAWAAMFNSSILGIDQDDDGNPEWPESEWQRTALEIALGAMYPDKAPDDALAEVAAARLEGDAGAAVQQLLLPATSAHVGVPRLLKGAIRRISTGISE